MKQLFACVLLLYAYSFSSNAQSPGLKWQIRDESNAWARSVLPTADSGLIIGASNLFKVNKEGVLLWKTPLNSYDEGYKLIKPSSDGAFFAFKDGFKGDSINAPDFNVIKFDGRGTVIWDKYFGGSATEELHAAIATPDGGCIMVGATYSDDGDVVGSQNYPYNPGTTDCWIIKVNAAGEKVWQKTLGGTGEDKAFRIVDNGSNGYVVGCAVNSNDYDFAAGGGGWLINMDASGNDIWKKRYADAEFFRDLIRTNNGDYVLLADNYSAPDNHGLADIWMTRLTSSGDAIWKKSYGTSENDYSDGAAITLTGDGGFAVAGGTNTGRADTVIADGDTSVSFSPAADVFLLKINAAGNQVWSQSFAGSGTETSSLHIRDNGNLVLVIATNSPDGYFAGGYNQPGLYRDGDVWLVELDDNGDEQYKKLFGSEDDDYAEGALLADGSIALYGYIDAPDSERLWVAKAGPANMIKATAFIDGNGNGIKESSENWTTAVTITATKDTATILAQKLSNDVFVMDVDNGSYEVTITPTYPYFTPIDGTQIISFTSYFNVDSVAFALRPVANKQDLVINAIPLTPARPGFTTTYKLYYKNAGTTSIPSGEIIFQKDSRLTLVSSLPAISSSTGDMLKWNYTNLAPADTASITLQLRVVAPPAVNNGDTLTSLAIITPVAGDETPSDDSAIIRHRVTGSFDPNDKYENNGGIIRPEHITQGDYLHYTIRFQNTGTDTAFGVTVRDTLDAKLDYSTIEMIASSHGYVLSIQDENQLAWNFPDINLPDSNINEVASHGFIAYRIKPKNTVALGDTIHNTASIYFDFNLPVLTNNAFTTVQNVVILPLKLFHFSGAYSNNTARLKWTTQGEYDFEKFIIERSSDGRNFKEVGVRLSSGGRSSISDYGYPDDLALVPGSTFFYRLKMRDTNGAESYSSIVTIRRGNVSGPVTIFPNPVRHETATATINATNEEVATIRLVDLSGRVLWTKVYSLNRGVNTIELNNLQDVPKGLYTIQFVTTTRAVNKEVLIVK